MAKNLNSELVRVNMNLPLNIVNRVKEYADNLGLNVTSAYIILLNQALEQRTAMVQLPNLLNLLNSLNVNSEQLKNAQDILESIAQEKNRKEEKM